MTKKRGKESKKGAGKARSHSKLDGAKFGRELRHAAEPVVRLANNPIVSELIASALIAGAGALARSPSGKQAAEAVQDEAGVLADGAGEAARKGADLAGLVAYSVAVAAGEIASRLAAAYERQVGSSDVAEQVAKAARQAADAAWEAFGQDRH